MVGHARFTVVSHRGGSRSKLEERILRQPIYETKEQLLHKLQMFVKPSSVYNIVFLYNTSVISTSSTSVIAYVYILM